MRSLTATVCVAASSAAALLLSGCSDPRGLRVAGPAVSPSPPAGPAEVTDPVYVSDAARRPLQRPASFALTDTVSLTGLRWTSWGDATAEATGGLSGMWCRPGCERQPYAVKVTLSGLFKQEQRDGREKQDRPAFYSRATLVSDRLPPQKAAELGRVSLHTPEF
ncbi:hypothetical protein [Streptomyces sp. CB02923]|uniref:hypothetical protein n=1 Tax=Streptomyces sp. CB02923 TaxID=1718985 RepID=UPI000938AE6D|nr:hypothetical protein [Streptomyces sp. CB02923]